MKNKILFILLILLYLLPTAYSQYYYDQGYSFFGGFSFPFFDLSVPNLLDFYSQNSSWVDFFIILALTIAVLSSALEEKFGKATPIVLGIILAIGFAGLEKQLNFNLGYFGPIILLIVFLLSLFTILWIFSHLFGLFHEHKASSIVGSILFGLVVLSILAYIFRDSLGGFGNISGTTILIVLLALTALFFWIWFFKRAHKPKEIPSQLAAPSVIPPKVESPQVAPQVQAENEAKKIKEDQESNRVILLVNYFLSLPEKLEKGEIIKDHFEERYKSTIAELQSFLEKYPNSTYKTKLLESSAAVNKAYEDTINKYKKEEASQLKFQQAYTDVFQKKVSNYLDSLQSFVNSTLNYDELFAKYNKALDFYGQYREEIKKDENLNNRFIAVLSKLRHKLGELKAQQELKDTTPEDKEELKKIIENVDFTIKNFNNLWAKNSERIKLLSIEAQKIYNKISRGPTKDQLKTQLTSLYNLILSLNTLIESNEPEKKLIEPTKKPSILKRIFSMKKEDKDYKVLKTLVDYFLNLLQKEDTTEEASNKGYKEILNQINSFLEKYPSSRFRQNLFYLQKQVNEAYNLYISKKKELKSTSFEDQQEFDKIIKTLNLVISKFDKLWEKDSSYIFSVKDYSLSFFKEIRKGPNKDLFKAELSKVYELENKLIELINSKQSKGQGLSITSEDEQIRELNSLISRLTSKEEIDVNTIKRLYSYHFNSFSGRAKGPKSREVRRRLNKLKVLLDSLALKNRLEVYIREMPNKEFQELNKEYEIELEAFKKMTNTSYREEILSLLDTLGYAVFLRELLEELVEKNQNFDRYWIKSKIRKAIQKANRFLVNRLKIQSKFPNLRMNDPIRLMEKQIQYIFKELEDKFLEENE